MFLSVNIGFDKNLALYFDIGSFGKHLAKCCAMVIFSYGVNEAKGNLLLQEVVLELQPFQQKRSTIRGSST